MREEERRDRLHEALAGRVDPMRRDTLFRITSMTKPVTAAATMLLVEEGRLGLDEPVDRLLPELADRQVLRRVDGPLDDTVPAHRSITVRDLLTLRMGFGIILAPPDFWASIDQISDDMNEESRMTTSEPVTELQAQFSPTTSSDTQPPTSGETGSGITLTDWEEQTTAVCEEFEPQQDAIVAARPEPATLAEVVELFDALTPVVDRYIAALGAIDVPDERATDVERTYELNELNGEAAATARAAAAGGDQAAFQQAVSALDSQSAELKTLLLDLGVPACT